MNIEPSHDIADKRRWKIVRCDTCSDVPGEVVTADEESGECCVHISGETKTHSFGSKGFKLVRRAR